MQLSILVNVGSDSGMLDHFPDREGVAFPRVHSCWSDDGCSETSSQTELRTNGQYPSYADLRVLIPDGEEATDSISCPTTPIACTAKQPGNQRRLPAPALLKLVTTPGLSAGEVDAAADKTGQLSSCRTARRLLDFDHNSYTEVASWLEQQISVRESARSSSPGSGNRLTGLPDGIAPAGAFAGTAAMQGGNMPPPAFQLLGLL